MSKRQEIRGPPPVATDSKPYHFVIIVVVVGALLVLSPYFCILNNVPLQTRATQTAAKCQPGAR